MKLHVMYDKSGRIVAAVRLDEGGDLPKHGHLGNKIGPPRPVMKLRHSTADLELPAEHAHLSFADACRQLEVDVAHPPPRLRPRARS